MTRTSLFWGAILTIIGLALLLSNLGFLQVNIWSLIWPAFLIALGIWVIWGVFMRDKQKGESVTVPLEGSTKARLTIKHGAGTLDISGWNEGSNLASGLFGGGVDVKKSRTQDELRVTLSMPPQFVPFFFQPNSLDWNVRVNDSIPLELFVEGGASSSHLNLTNLKLSRFELHTGASTSEVQLPKNAGHTRVKVEAGVASTKLIVPLDVAARIRVPSGLTASQIDRDRFPRMGNVYQSPNYEDAINKVDIEVSSGLGAIEIRSAFE